MIPNEKRGYDGFFVFFNNKTKLEHNCFFLRLVAKFSYFLKTNSQIIATGCVAVHRGHVWIV